MTTLTDATTYRADAIRALYAQRREVELHFHQIKILLGQDILRCKSRQSAPRALWEKDEVRSSQLVFIRKGLDEARIRDELKKCLA